jgi:hypothetical protein
MPLTLALPVKEQPKERKNQKPHRYGHPIWHRTIWHGDEGHSERGEHEQAAKNFKRFNQAFGGKSGHGAKGCPQSVTVATRSQFAAKTKQALRKDNAAEECQTPTGPERELPVTARPVMKVKGKSLAAQPCDEESGAKKKERSHRNVP